MVQVAVLGHGVVGSGVVEVLLKNAAGIAKRSGEELNVKYILDIRDFPGLPYADRFTKDFNRIVNDPEIRVVAEVMGGVTPAYDFVKACLLAGKSVVTSNKELVAAKGAELLACAGEHGQNFLFEASVGGGIPVIRPMHQCLVANEITEIAGILNGTTNFILTKMRRENMEFDEALGLARQLGYAEANPAADIEGRDSCRKICILASLAFGTHFYPENVHTEGITGVTAADMHYAGGAGYAIKLIAQARRLEDGRAYLLVSPALIPNGSQLAGIDDVFNGILVRGDFVGDVVFYGRGAGKLPTASAVVGDMVECAQAAGTIKSLRWGDSSGNNVADYTAQPSAAYVRCKGSPAGIKAAFGEVSPLSRPGQPSGEAAFLLPPQPEAALQARLDAAKAGGVEVLGMIRVLEY
jgi:homoserine dehydrogenase